ncbi:restriction endonuclease subunit S [Candidatus Poriferisocius sp.]|uniref:restriction endonuclease subunit S n=1 Tax=Candidatus Poriferisocius sp. TaxID=3101276 RepID=UPI003B026842
MRDLLVEEVVAQRKGSIKIGPFGSALPRSAMVRDGVKVYGQENLISRDWSIGDRRITPETFEMLRSCELNPGDVVIGMMGSLGHCEVFPSGAEPGIMDSHLLRIQTDRGLLIPEYLRLLLLSGETIQQIDRLSHGSIMAGLSSRVVRTLRVLVPPVEEQLRIAEALNTIDETIHSTKNLICKLELQERGMKQSLIGSHQGVDDIWKEIRVGELGRIVTGTTPPTSDDRYWDGEVPFVTPGDIDTAGNVVATNRTVTQFGASLGKIVPAGSIAVVCIGSTVGKMGWITQSSVTNQQINCIVPSGQYLSEFIYYILELVRPNIEAEAGRQAIPIVNANLLSMLPVFVCPLDIQKEIIINITPIRDRIRQERQMLSKYVNLRSGLATDLLSGRVRMVAA